FHRQLNAAIKCHSDERLSEALPIVVLRIRVAYREHLQTSAAELVYGETLRLPSEFFTSARDYTEAAKMVRQPGSRHGTQKKKKKTFVHIDLATVSPVFVRVDSVKGLLENPYEGLFPVTSQNAKTDVIQMKGKDAVMSIGRLKPAYICEDETKTEQLTCKIRCGRVPADV
ncbi:hypothetical protein WN55_00297, partial [Dufourea novaeangliae]